MPAYELKQMSRDRLEAIAADWKVKSGDDEFAIELAEVFSWAREHLMHRPGFGHAVELVDVETGEAGAILEIVDSPNVELTKLLKVTFSPAYWPLDYTEENARSIASILAGAIAGLIDSGIDKGFKVAKIYGRSQFMYSILSKVSENWAVIAPTSAAMEGRWLRVSLKGVGK